MENPDATCVICSFFVFSLQFKSLFVSLQKLNNYEEDYFRQTKNNSVRFITEDCGLLWENGSIFSVNKLQALAWNISEYTNEKLRNTIGNLMSFLL